MSQKNSHHIMTVDLLKYMESSTFVSDNTVDEGYKLAIYL
jgi:hypothetical protein